MPSSPSKKSTLSRRFTELINQKTPRRPSSGEDTKEGITTPPLQTTTPSTASSPLSIQSSPSDSPLQGHRFTFDEQHRLPVTFLPFVATETSFMKLDIFGSEETNHSEFDFTTSSESSNWFNFSETTEISSFEMPEPITKARKERQAPKTMTIGWVCEDGFRPIGGFD